MKRKKIIRNIVHKALCRTNRRIILELGEVAKKITSNIPNEIDYDCINASVDIYPQNKFFIHVG